MILDVTATVMAHPARREMAEDLQAKLTDGMGIEGHVDIVVDEYGEGVWATARRCWEGRPRWSDHHLVIQDDALVPVNLLWSVQEIVEGLGKWAALSLYCGNENAVQLGKDGPRLAHARVALHAVANVLPTAMVDEWLEWVDLNCDPLMPGDDYRLSMFLLARGIKCYYTCPPAVQHGEPRKSLHDKVPVAQVEGLRMASQWLGEEADALEVEWFARRTKTLGVGDPASYGRYYRGPGTWKEAVR